MWVTFTLVISSVRYRARFAPQLSEGEANARSAAGEAVPADAAGGGATGRIPPYARTRAMHFSSIAIGVGNAVMPRVVRQGAAAGSGKYSAHTAL